MSEEDQKKFETRMIETLKTYLTIMLFLFGIFGGVIGWNTVERIKLTKDYEQLRTDFGVTLIYMSAVEQEANPMYSDIIKRYFPNLKRGAQVQ